jgi:hypothetical protein
MNDKQKIFVMVGVGSLVLILVTVFGLGFPLNENYFFSEVWEKNKYGGLPLENQYSLRKLDGTLNWKPSLLYTKTNWLGIIAVFNIILSATGFFLFKDK